MSRVWSLPTRGFERFYIQSLAKYLADYQVTGAASPKDSEAGECPTASNYILFSSNTTCSHTWTNLLKHLTAHLQALCTVTSSPALWILMAYGWVLLESAHNKPQVFFKKKFTSSSPDIRQERPALFLLLSAGIFCLQYGPRQGRDTTIREIQDTHLTETMICGTMSTD